MGQTQAAAIADIDLTRRRLDSELDELATYLPPTTERIKRIASIAAGMAAGLALVSLALRKRRELRALRHLRSIEDRLARMEARLSRP
jgi:hypothetical protein